MDINIYEQALKNNISELVNRNKTKKCRFKYNLKNRILVFNTEKQLSHNPHSGKLRNKLNNIRLFWLIFTDKASNYEF